MTAAEGSLYNKAQMLALVADPSRRLEVRQSIGLVVHFHGSTAVVTGAFYKKKVDKGRPPERRTDTWINLNGRWQCVSSHFSVPIERIPTRQS